MVECPIANARTKKILYNTHYPTFKEFKSACLNFFKRQHLYEEEVFSMMGMGY